jgi:hypothetical protein
MIITFSPGGVIQNINQYLLKQREVAAVISVFEKIDN